MPTLVLESELFNRLFENVSRQEKSEIIAMKSVKETIKLLAKNPSQEARIQRKVIGASLSSPEFGLPQLGLTWREEQEAMEMKKKLVSGESSVLMMPAKKPRQVFPPEVLQLAVQHWESTTTVDPSKHKRLVKVVKDDQEVVPTRWQTTTNEEAYESFQQMHTEDIRKIMSEHAKKYKETYINRPHSADRTYRLKYAEGIPDRFPGITWYLETKPPEVKWMNDHTTGLCKVGIQQISLIIMIFFFTDG